MHVLAPMRYPNCLRIMGSHINPRTSCMPGISHLSPSLHFPPQLTLGERLKSVVAKSRAASRAVMDRLSLLAHGMSTTGGPQPTAPSEAGSHASALKAGASRRGSVTGVVEKGVRFTRESYVRLGDDEDADDLDAEELMAVLRTASRAASAHPQVKGPGAAGVGMGPAPTKAPGSGSSQAAGSSSTPGSGEYNSAVTSTPQQAFQDPVGAARGADACARAVKAPSQDGCTMAA